MSRNTQATSALLERYRSYGFQKLIHKFYLDMRHELLNETNRDEVQHDILAWSNKFC